MALLFGSVSAVFLSTFASSLLLLLFWQRHHHKNKKLRLPPGPTPLPLIGTLYAHSMWPQSLSALRKKYGDYVTVYIGPMRLVLLLSYAAIKEATIDKGAHFSHRGFGHSFMFRSVNPDLNGIIEHDYDEELERKRKLVTSVFRTLGVGRTVMQAKILENAQDLCDSFGAVNGKPFYPKTAIQTCVANVILHISLNKKFNQSDCDFQQALTDTDNYLKAGTDLFILDRLPFLRFFPHFNHSYETFIYGNRGMLSFMWKYVQELINNFSPDSPPENVVSCLLHDGYNHKTGQLEVDEKELKYLLRDLLLAGFETTATSVQWILINLANYPKYQQAIHKEISEAVKDRLVQLSDRLTLLEAFILETIRFRTIAPVAPRHTMSDTTLGGYHIPANTTTILSLHDSHHDATYWRDPEVFRPERFLDDSGSVLTHAHMIPFSLGKRACLGELLARQELILFTGTLVQRFHVRPPDGLARVSEAVALGGTVCPKPFYIVAEPRS